MNTVNREELETRLLLEAISTYYGYDFHNYATASMSRRIDRHMQKVGLQWVSELIPRFLHDRETFNDFVKDMSVVVTEMFRDPTFFLTLRQKVIPLLRTYPFIKIWHAGCASGQEVYSMAILLEEEGLLERCQIYATDFNEDALNMARKGIYPEKELEIYEDNYRTAGGKKHLADYCLQQYNSIKLNERLKKRITFANHNLVTDGIFGEMNLVLCRNVLIYFNQKLQDRVLELLLESLTPRGVLCIGRRENILFSAINDCLIPLNQEERIYRKKT